MGKSLQIIKQAGGAAITSVQGVFRAVEGLNDKQTVAFLVNNQLAHGSKVLSYAEMIEILTKKGLSKKTVIQIINETATAVAKAKTVAVAKTQIATNVGFKAFMETDMSFLGLDDELQNAVRRITGALDHTFFSRFGYARSNVCCN